jgi:hypothetical protein
MLPSYVVFSLIRRNKTAPIKKNNAQQDTSNKYSFVIITYMPFKAVSLPLAGSLRNLFMYYAQLRMQKYQRCPYRALTKVEEVFI